MTLPRIDCDQLRAQGMSITIRKNVRRPYPKKRRYNPAMNPLSDHVTAAVAAYQALPSPKKWGSLSRIAERFNTTPGTILNRINRTKNK